jgi:hypothetical protein
MHRLASASLRRANRRCALPILAFCLFSLGNALQWQVSAGLSAQGWGLKELRSCSLCGARDARSNGIEFAWQFLPVWHRLDFVARPGRAKCRHEWRVQHCRFGKTVSPFACILQDTEPASRRSSAWLVITSNTCFLAATLLICWSSVEALVRRRKQNADRRFDVPEDRRKMMGPY